MFISAQSYGAILLLLGIIRRWPSASYHKAPVTPTLCLAMQIKLFPMPPVFKSRVVLPVFDALPEETPEEEEYYDRRNAGNRTILFQ